MKNDETAHGIILAGSQPWAASPLDEVCSRPLLPLLGRPVIWFVLNWFRSAGIRRVSICGARVDRSLQEYLGDGRCLDMTIEYREDRMPRGTAGCLRDAAIRTSASELVVVDATVLTDLKLDELLTAHRRSQAGLTVVAGKAPGSPGPNHLQPAGIYVVSRPALEYIPASTYQDIKEMWIPRLYQHQQKVVSHHVAPSSYMRVLNGQSYLNAAAWALQSLRESARLEPGYKRMGESLVHSSVRLAPSARLVGACLIGPECRVRDHTTLIGPTVLGARSVVGASCIVSQTAAWNAVRIGTGCVLDKVILVTGAAVDAGEIIRETVWGPMNSTRNPAELYWWPAHAGATTQSPSLKLEGRLGNHHPELSSPPSVPLSALA